MQEASYNIPKQYKVDKGMPLSALFDRIDNRKCKKIFESGVESVKWCYHMTDAEGISNMMQLVKEPGLSVFEVTMKTKISSELLTEIFASILQRPILMVYLCDGELAMGTYMPAGEKSPVRMCSTDFFPYDEGRIIDILDFEVDCGKNVEQIHKRILSTLKMQRRVIMIEKAFERINKDKDRENLFFEFSLENLDRIREDAEFVKEQLKVLK